MNQINHYFYWISGKKKKEKESLTELNPIGDKCTMDRTVDFKIKSKIVLIDDPI